MKKHKSLAQIMYEAEAKSTENMIKTLKRLNKRTLIDPYLKSEKSIDLHTHTSYSDGDLTPSNLIHYAIEKRIGILAITDHDTIEGIKTVDRESHLIKETGIKIINGIELTAKVNKGRMHILGYGIDLENKNLNDKMLELKTNSLHSVLSVMEQIKRDYGIRFSYDEIVQLVNAKNNLGRVDLARLCVKNNYADSVQDAFNKYLIEAHKKIVKGLGEPNYEECINLIRESGGTAVLAHPKSLELNQKELLILIKDLIKYGLEGIEVYHPSHSNEEIGFYKEIANDYNLLVSGGSDFHGPKTKPDIDLGQNLDAEKCKKLTLTKKQLY